LHSVCTVASQLRNAKSSVSIFVYGGHISMSHVSFHWAHSGCPQPPRQVLRAHCVCRHTSVLLARTHVHPHTPCALCFLIDTRNQRIPCRSKLSDRLHSVCTVASQLRNAKSSVSIFVYGGHTSMSHVSFHWAHSGCPQPPRQVLRAHCVCRHTSGC
jgi:hypothetical protein